jgi:hypothetical protein
MRVQTRTRRAAARGSILLLASVFIFLMAYIALSAVDIAAVEARLAGGVKEDAESRVLLQGATLALARREVARLQPALKAGARDACAGPEPCLLQKGELAFADSPGVNLSYQSRLLGREVAGAIRRDGQARVSSHAAFRRWPLELELRLQRQRDGVTLQRAAIGVETGTAREGWGDAP